MPKADGGVKRQGSKNGASKLTEDQVREIRRLNLTRTHPWIAEQYGVTVSNIAAIVSGKTWKHVL